MQAEYGTLARFLHRLALGNPWFARACLDLQTQLFPPGRGVAEGDHIFICGLARSGTTALLNVLHDSRQFRSLTYRDMPFVLLPSLWSRLSRIARQQATQRIRAHGDGLVVGYDSPEAFEEVFFRAFCGEEYIREDRLTRHHPSSRVMTRYLEYVGSLLGETSPSTPSRYLAKNNNHVLRLQALRQALPNAVVLVPFRKPLEHAASLLQQHLHFTSLQNEDRFGLSYMRWLGHHEFGLDQRPFEYSAGQVETLHGLARDAADYWLQSWIQTYEHLLEEPEDGLLFFDYDRCCDAPARYLGALLHRLDVDLSAEHVARYWKRPRLHDVPVVRNPALLEQAGIIHAHLQERAFAGVGAPI